MQNDSSTLTMRQRPTVAPTGFIPTDPASIVAEARTWVGVPWHHQGRSRYGIDCAGLIIQIAAACGVFIPDLKIYPKTPDPRLVDIMTRSLMTCALEPACIGLFQFAKEPWHVGLYTGDSLIHAYDGKRKKQVIESPWNRYWSKDLTACYRFPP